MIFAFGVLVIGIGGLIPTNSLQASNTSVSHLGGELSNAEKILVCCELDSNRILDLDTALTMLRDGRMTITKIDSGVYRVVVPGGLLDIILEIDG